ncbi:MAG: isocitrate lyase/phosphoenolpyruvate mutase family protein [Pseudomonadota bacterium]
MTSTPAARLRELMARPGMITAPGAYDGITARMIAAAGHACVYMTGSGTAATYGYPDYGLVTMTEMVANADRIVRASGLPLIADADTGYGNELNVTRAVHEYERRGVAAIHLEDQEFPKKCGHLDDKAVISADAFCAKIAAAANARRSSDFVVIARTDARAVEGFDAAIDRANRALEAGADVIFFEATQSEAEMADVPKRVEGPCLLNLVYKGKTPFVPLATAQDMGYKIAILPSLLLRHVFGACEEILAKISDDGPLPTPAGDYSPAEGFAKFGAAEWDALRTRFRE